MKIRQPIPISSETLNPDCRPAGRCEPDNPSSYLLFCISPYAYSIWMSEIILKEKKIEILFIKFLIPRPLAAGLPFKIGSRACPGV